MSPRKQKCRQLGTGSSSLSVGDRWKTCWVSPAEITFLEMELRQRSWAATEAKGGLVSVFQVLIYIFEMGERNLLAFTDKTEEISRAGEVENECKGRQRHFSPWTMSWPLPPL